VKTWFLTNEQLCCVQIIFDTKVQWVKGSERDLIARQRGQKCAGAIGVSYVQSRRL